jgi:hypothetical protein
MNKKKHHQKGIQNNKGIQANIINAQSIAVGKGATAIVNQKTASINEIDEIFSHLREKAESLKNKTDRDEANLAISALEKEARKGDDAQEKIVAKWVNFLFETAPDIWDVAITTFLNPIKGVSLVFQKVADRSKSGKSNIRGTNK